MTTTFPPPGRYEPTPLPVRRFTVDEYHRMIEDGYFSADERFELLEGLIVEKMSRNPPHDAHVAHARRVLDRRLPPAWHVRVRSALTTATSEPEPDLAIVPGTELDYVRSHPGPMDAALVVEVASTSLYDDQTIKYRIYAHSGVHVYWIVNLAERRIEVYGDPSGPSSAPAYASALRYLPGQAVPLSIGGAEVGPVPVDELLPQTL